MFPASLQKNIWELDRQISLLETECENIKVETRDASPGKMNSKPLKRKVSNKFSVGNLCSSEITQAPKMPNLFPMMPKANTPTNDESSGLGDSQNSVNVTYSEKKENDINDNTRESNPRGNIQNDKKQATPGGKKETILGYFEGKKFWKGSVHSIRRMTESSNDNYPVRTESVIAEQENVSAETSKKPQILCESFKEQNSPEKKQQKKNKTPSDKESFFGQNTAAAEFSSEEEVNRSRGFAGGEDKSPKEKWAKEMERPITPISKSSNKRRPRSARTRKNSKEVPLDVIITKTIHEKEIQCKMWNEEKEKAEFLLNLNESFSTLNHLIGELRTKLSREKRNDVLNNMQNILMNIAGFKTLTTLQNPLPALTSLKGTNGKSLDGEVNIMDLRKALTAVKKFCQELSEEKSTLVEELNEKISVIASFKNKEKEYLSLISSLKFNLEKVREEVEAEKLAKRDLLIAKTKLREEAKVIEALKKSHGKLQDLIKIYVLENDKLKTEVKIMKLESEKFGVLLAGKEGELKKYKHEIELFQRQITQQLSLLRSKATENEVEQAIEAISTQTNILQTEIDSLPSESTLGKGDIILRFDLNTSSNRTETNPPSKQGQPSKNQKQKREVESTKVSSLSSEQNVKKNMKDGAPMLGKTDDSEPTARVDEKNFNYGLGEVLSSSKNLRNSINEMLEDMRMTSEEKFWSSLTNSTNNSRCSMTSSYSENSSECTPRD